MFFVCCFCIILQKKTHFIWGNIGRHSVYGASRFWLIKHLHQALRQETIPPKGNQQQKQLTARCSLVQTWRKGLQKNHHTAEWLFLNHAVSKKYHAIHLLGKKSNQPHLGIWKKWNQWCLSSIEYRQTPKRWSGSLCLCWQTWYQDHTVANCRTSEKMFLRT